MSSTVLSIQEQARYSRHLNLPQFGIATQEKLKSSRVLVVGTGGLGAPLLQYLTAAGVGTIGVVDFDVVDESNLQRQVLFGTSDIGKDKTSVAIERLKDQNPHVKFIEYKTRLDSSNALEIVRDYDVIADGTDNFPTRYLVNDACVLAGKTNVYASIFQFEGQVSVFNHLVDGERGPNYRDLFPSPPPPGMVPSCAEGGVLGVLPGIVGSIQAAEVIKVLTGIGSALVGRLFVFDALDFSARTLNVRKDPSNPISGSNPTIHALIDYEEFCGMKDEVAWIEWSVDQLRARRDEVILIDVREPYEYEAANIGGQLIPMGKLEEHLDEIPTRGHVVVHCKAGGRSAKAIQMLSEKHGYANLINLQGGILAWKERYNPDLAVI
ncbi:MAG: molybdopterin-synthase adenylyltransferase MoeB [Bacteroidota bacterium]